MLTKFQCKGSAILTALFIMVLVAIAATAMSLRLQIDINRTQSIKDMGTMKRLAQKQVLTAMLILQNNLDLLGKQKEKIDNTPYHFNSKNESGFKMKSLLDDEQAKFNLNNLRDKKYIKPFARLLQIVNPQIKLKEAIMISYAVNDWVSPLDMNKGKTPFDGYYVQHHYMQSHLPMVTPTELRLVKGITPMIYEKTLPYLTALPTKTPVNLNRASLPVLQTIGVGLSEKQAKTIVEARGKKGFLSKKAFLQNEKVQALHLKLKGKDYTLTSRYFISTVEVRHEEEILTLFTLIDRQRNKRRSHTHILRQTINTI